MHITQWDLDWQDVYHYAQPIALPAGSTVTLDYTYDNSTANVRNPNRPPRRVTYGQQTRDEMAELWFQVVPRRAAERGVLVQSLYAKILPEEIVGRRMMLEHDPGNVALHDDLALLYADAGDPAAVVVEFKASLRVAPASASARYNVGAALLAVGDRAAARGFLESALAADPDYARAHSDLAVVLQASGDVSGAILHHRQALGLKPANADVQLSAGVAFALAGDPVEGARHIREALRIQPDWPNAMAALASVVAGDPAATAEDRRAAVMLAERAVQATEGKNAAFVAILDAARRAAR